MLNLVLQVAIVHHQHLFAIQVHAINVLQTVIAKLQQLQSVPIMFVVHVHQMLNVQRYLD